MLMLNGVFSHFTKLSDFWQTVLVAGAIFTSGLGIGFTVKDLVGLPDRVKANTLVVDSVVSNQENIKNAQDEQKVINIEFRETLNNISHSVNNIAEDVRQTKWRVEILACYNDTVPVSRACLEDARPDS